MERKLYSARLERKVCISEIAQCYHFNFVIDELESFPFVAGQFISTIAEDPKGKQQTRAYSIASAASGNRFDLCVNRVEGGFFSNHLADLTDLPPGGTVKVHGPHGHFVLREPVRTRSLFPLARASPPCAAYAQWLFPEDGPDRSDGRDIWMVYGTRYESELYYREEFEALAHRKPNFHYVPTLSRGDEHWTGLRGYVQEHVARIVEKRAARLGINLPLPPVDPAIPPAELDSMCTRTSAGSTTWLPGCARSWPTTAGTASRSCLSATIEAETSL